MGTLLALASAVSYGISDFAGGLLSRRVSFAAIALAGQLGGLVLAVAIAGFVPANVAVADLGWGALSGVGTGVGMLFLCRGLGNGSMSVVVPTSAVDGVALPVLIGVAFLGERPSVAAWFGVVLALPALWLVSRSEGGTDGVGDGLIASAGIALQYVALAQAGPGSGIWPVVTGRVAAIVTILPLVLSHRPRLPIRIALPAAATGAAAVLLLPVR
ncbi:EamA family transporter [Amycolatopsis acidiphila]|uniref:EamA family transporter n=1 Tax=Amycolatopsis acidiphila TaxID=715473 RepID=A0A558ADG0_9PSEU|nr:EamA family transporter [Amycolatopsis acidiphila]TVT22301.1 EamA family transporter [Amycolatopsis acidiphila]UIJ57984.1 EamA family transporter [Amycolatopsis acidiphila]GHG70711.1 hypothetical protein GCM10017788_32100 [Amycolatopsis acidiphila]